jgi:ribosomal protein S27E
MIRSSGQPEGTEEGALCRRDGCEGELRYAEVENCSCHLSALCWGHENTRLECPVCGWEEDE